MRFPKRKAASQRGPFDRLGGSVSKGLSILWARGSAYGGMTAPPLTSAHNKRPAASCSTRHDGAGQSALTRTAVRGQLPVEGAEGAGGACVYEEQRTGNYGQEAERVDASAPTAATGPKPVGAGRGTEGTMILAVLANRLAPTEQKVNNQIGASFQHLCDDGGRKQRVIFRVPMRKRAIVKVYEARSFSCEKNALCSRHTTISSTFVLVYSLRSPALLPLLHILLAASFPCAALSLHRTCAPFKRGGWGLWWGSCG